MSGLAALDVAPVLAAGGKARIRTTSNSPSRKVIVGTAMQAFWGPYPGLGNRLEQLARMVDQMATQAREKHGRGLDLAVLPETAITGEAGEDVLARAVPFAGQVQEMFTRKAREHGISVSLRRIWPRATRCRCRSKRSCTRCACCCGPSKTSAPNPPSNLPPNSNCPSPDSTAQRQKSNSLSFMPPE